MKLKDVKVGVFFGGVPGHDGPHSLTQTPTDTEAIVKKMGTDDPPFTVDPNIEVHEVAVCPRPFHKRAKS